jgi:hydrogenase maturation factor HypF (carbamoyltransferase family)
MQRPTVLNKKKKKKYPTEPVGPIPRSIGITLVAMPTQTLCLRLTETLHDVEKAS